MGLVPIPEILALKKSNMTLPWSVNNIYKMADSMDSFSIATNRDVLSKQASSTSFWVFCMTRPGIEHNAHGLLRDTLTIMPMSR